MFDPFFTIRKAFKGSGPGLSNACNRIKRHKGKDHVNNRVVEGTTFIIELPVEMEPHRGGG